MRCEHFVGGLRGRRSTLLGFHDGEAGVGLIREGVLSQLFKQLVRATGLFGRRKKRSMAEGATAMMQTAWSEIHHKGQIRRQPQRPMGPALHLLIRHLR